MPAPDHFQQHRSAPILLVEAAQQRPRLASSAPAAELPRISNPCVTRRAPKPRYGRRWVVFVCQQIEKQRRVVHRLLGIDSRRKLLAADSARLPESTKKIVAVTSASASAAPAHRAPGPPRRSVHPIMECPPAVAPAGRATVPKLLDSLRDDHSCLLRKSSTDRSRCE